MACFQYLLFFALFSPQVLLPSYQSTQTATLASSTALKKYSIVDDVDINKSTGKLFSIFIARGDSLACFALFFNRTKQQTKTESEGPWERLKLLKLLKLHETLHWLLQDNKNKKNSTFSTSWLLVFRNDTAWKIHQILMSCPVILTLRWSKYSQWLL